MPPTFHPPSRVHPPLPPGRPSRFRATVHGIAFSDRARAVATLGSGDRLTLLPDPPMEDAPRVWVHLASGEPAGHLPTEIGDWLAPWMLRGGRADARVLRVSGAETPSWRRLLVEVSCEVEGRDSEGGDAQDPQGGDGEGLGGDEGFPGGNTDP